MSAETEFRSIVGSLPCQVHWGDCDPAGIIFYPTYFRWIDAASWALFELAGFASRTTSCATMASRWRRPRKRGSGAAT